MIYHHASREIDALLEETLIVDDMRENESTAVRLGMPGFHFPSACELLSEFAKLNHSALSALPRRAVSNRRRN
jgi:FMN phosphatase YigB (HAD superfamily)